MKNLKQRIPSSFFDSTVTLLILLTFFTLAFQKPLLHKTLKSFSLAIIPSDLTLPAYHNFSIKLTLFLSDILLILLLIRVIYLQRGQWAQFLWSGPSKYLTLLFITALFSIGASSTSNYLLMYTRFIQLVLIAVLFNSIKMAFDAHTIAPFIRSLAYLLFALALFESALALAQYFSQDRVGLKFLGESNRQWFTFPMPNGYRSLFDTWFHIQRNPEQLMRSTGTFPHPNIFGGFLFCTLLNTFYLYFTEQNYKKLLLSGIVLQMLALTVSFSRAAFIALFLSTALYFLFQARSPENRTTIKQLILTLLASSSLCLALFYPQLMARGGIVNYNGLVQGADTERLAYQKIAIAMIKERPFLGIGLNNFQIESHRFFPEGRILTSKVHNIYLLFAAETGLLGGSCFLLFLFSILKNIKRSFQSQHGLFLFSLFTGLLFIGACDFYFISTPHGRILFFGFAALLYTATYGIIDEKSYCPA